MSATQVQTAFRYLQLLAAMAALLIASAVRADQASTIFLPSELHPDRLVVRRYAPAETVVIDIRDLELLVEEAQTWERLPEPLHYYDTYKRDYKLLLLQNGLARLRTPATAPAEYQAAETTARTKRVGGWERILPAPAPRPTPTPAPPTDTTADVLSDAAARTWKFLATWLLPLGVASGVAAFLYRKLYIQRRPRLLIIGEGSAGKTALCERILDPNADPATILKLSQSDRVQRRKRMRHIVHGRFELYPVLTDVPGAAFGQVWDELSRKWFRPPHVLVLVMAPTPKPSDGERDSRFVDVQLGYAQAFVGGVLGSRRANKPKAVALFLNKFDLASHDAPADTAAVSKKTAFEAIFKEHREVVQLACKKAKIPCHVVVGSALAAWNTQRVIELIGDSLYA